MKKFLPAGLVLLLLAVFLIPMTVATSTTPGVPGEGFTVDDPCGYVMGTSTSTTDADGNELNTGGNIVFDFAASISSYRLCTKSNGYFYSTYANGWLNQVGWLDFGWTKPSSVSVASYWANVPNIDPLTGDWTGYAWNEIVGWVWFDWDCTVSCDTSNRVKTDTTTGVVSGYAWNDQIGWISFKGLTQELPPMNISASVSIENGAGDDISAIDNTNAPVADGYEYYKVKLVLTDNNTGATLTSADLSRVEIDINSTADSNIYLNQVENTGNAVVASKTNYALVDCHDLPGTVYSCETTDSLGETSFNYFVYSGAPTSDMEGTDTDGDGVFDVYNDRAGGTSIYESPTGSGTASSSRMTYFNERSNSRNKFTIDSVDFYLVFADSGRAVTVDGLTDGGVVDVDPDPVDVLYAQKYTYTPSATANLSYRPRFISSNFKTFYDAEERDTIGDTTTTDMYVHSYGVILRPSSEYRTVNGTTSGGSYTVNYEAASDATGTTDLKFLIDSADDGVMDSRQHVDSMTASASTDSYYGTSTANKDYRIGYAQESPGALGASPTNPTLEEWVCDQLSYTSDPVPTTSLVWQVTGNRGMQSCYFTGYLPRPDARVGAEAMTLLGSINSSISEQDVISSDTSGVSILGAANYVNLRNDLYSQVARLIRNQTPTTPTICGILNSSMAPINYSTCRTTSITSLMSNTLFYANSDVYVQGSTSFSDKTLVVDGADVYISGNVYGGKLGIIAFSQNGRGGNVYIDPGVTDLYVNIFADGTVFSDSGNNTGGPNGVTPVWGSASARADSLINQLYIKGSIVSRNTIGGASASSAPYNLGDGTTSNRLDVAKEFDLNKLREFSVCYPLDGSGNPDTGGTPVDCAGTARSSQYGSLNNSPLIVEYDPPSSVMPIFNISSLNISGR